jgi:hypothetical protein
MNGPSLTARSFGVPQDDNRPFAVCSARDPTSPYPISLLARAADVLMSAAY